MQRNHIYRGDCIEIMQQLPAESVDVIFADPPYNLQLSGDLWRPDQSMVDAVDDSWDQFESVTAYDRFTRAWMSAARRLLTEEGTLWVIGSYHNIYRVGKVLMDLDFWILNDIVWVKTNPMPNFRGTRFTNAHETLLWAQKHQGKRYTFNYQAMKALHGGKQMRSDWHLPICAGSERITIDGEKAHSTQKPEALLYRVILASTNPGDLILDPFFGTGTTGAVARMLHRDWVGIERDPAYAEIAQQRIDAVEPGDYDTDVYRFIDKRRRKRIPFGSLIERGLIAPGQPMRFRNDPDLEATVLANGKLLWKGQRGSIHQIGKAILDAPSCNGWTHWYIEDGNAWVVLDTLRERVRAESRE